MPKTALILSPDALASAFGEPVLRRLRTQLSGVLVIAPSEGWSQYRDALREIEVVFSGWGAPVMDAEFLDAVPRLKIVFYAGGSVRYFITNAFWRRGVRLTTAQTINAIPVAEFVLSAILLGLKRFWHYARVTRETRTFPAERPMPGAYGARVGLISYGTIARLVRQKLRSFDTEVLVYDPFLSAAEVARDNVRHVSLDELCATADVVSLHAPQLPETTGLLTGAHFESMKPGAVFINTARGEIVDEPAMIDVLQRRTDLQAVLDVTSPEPPAPASPLYTLPNVVLTPHIAGSVDRECLRLGHAMIDEFERYIAGQPLFWEIDARRAAQIA